MYNVINHIRVVAAHREEFEQRFRENLRHLDGVPGFVRVRIWRPSASANPDGAYPADAPANKSAGAPLTAFRGWVGSPSFRASHANPMPDAWKAGAAMMSQHELAFEESKS